MIALKMLPQKKKKNINSEAFDLPFSSHSTIKAKRLAVAFNTSGGNTAFPPLLSIDWKKSQQFIFYDLMATTKQTQEERILHLSVTSVTFGQTQSW